MLFLNLLTGETWQDKFGKCKQGKQWQAGNINVEFPRDTTNTLQIKILYFFCLLWFNFHCVRFFSSCSQVATWNKNWKWLGQIEVRFFRDKMLQ